MQVVGEVVSLDYWHKAATSMNGLLPQALKCSFTHNVHWILKLFSSKQMERGQTFRNNFSSTFCLAQLKQVSFLLKEYWTIQIEDWGLRTEDQYDPFEDILLSPF